MRGLVMDFPADRKARNVDDEYLFGPAFLVAPVTEFKARSREVYLPSRRRLVRLRDRQGFQGRPDDQGRRAPVERMPLFVTRRLDRADRRVVQQYVGEQPDGRSIVLHVFTGADGSVLALRGRRAEQRLRARGVEPDPDELRQRLGPPDDRRAVGKSFKGMLENRTIKVRFIGSGAKPVDFEAVDETVAYSGQPVVVMRK